LKKTIYLKKGRTFRKEAKMVSTHIRLFILFFIAVGLFTGCKDSSTGVVPGENVSVSLAADKGLNKNAVDVIILDTVKILLRDIKFSKSLSDSANIKIGPMVIKLNLDGTPTEFAAGIIPAGNYSKIKFRIHKLEDGEVPPDPEFLEGYAQTLRYSVIVKGRYNGVAFIYKSTKSAHQEVDFKKLVDLSVDFRSNVTLSVDVNSWFFKGDLVLNPNIADNFNDIDNNIKDSFKKAFKDNNRDGIAD
jgi:hypothetical protein